MIASVFRQVDEWVFARGRARDVAILRITIAALIALRAALWPFGQLAGSPDALFYPPWFLTAISRVPPLAVVLALQVVGVVAGLTVVARRGRRAGYAMAWLAFLVLAGFKTSTGKLLHNDVMVLLVGLPLLLAPDASLNDRRVDRRFGWPQRTALVTVAIIYATCGWQKVVHSGGTWVFSDNMRWILYGGAASGKAPTSWLSLFVADRPILAVLAAAGLLLFELAFPIALFVRRTRMAFAFGAVALHSTTWLTLGLDYWSWSIAAATVLWLLAAPARVRPPSPALEPSEPDTSDVRVRSLTR